MKRAIPLVAVVMAGLCAQATLATAQPYAEEPTDGIELPAVPLSGEHDALSVAKNPAGVGLLRGASFAAAVHAADPDAATTAGPGVGLYVGSSIGGGLLPNIGYGIGLEVLRPPERRLAPDPGTPVRLTFAYAPLVVGGSALGIAYHHFYDDEGSTLAGVDTWDVGLSTRIGARFAVGAVVRDLTTPDAGGAPVQRRYELELTSRPLATSALQLSLGGRIGEVRADLEGWLKWSWRVMRGLYFNGELSTRALFDLDGAAAPAAATERREYVATAGLEVSFGSVGAAAYATGSSINGDDPRFLGGTIIARASAVQVPSVFGHGNRIERVVLSGEMSARNLTGVIRKLDKLARDPGVVAVFVQMEDLSVGWGSAQEIRGALTNIRNAKKRVFAYMISGSTRDYFIATAADKIYVDPAGGLWLSGLAGTSIYFKGLFDKLGVNAQFEKIAAFKTAPEMFTRTAPSEAATLMRNRLYDSMYGSIVTAIASGRGLSPDKVKALIEGGPYTAGELSRMPKVIDAIATPDELTDVVARELGAYYPVASAPREVPDRWSYPAIAVIYIDGDIVSGNSRQVPVLGRRFTGGKTITEAIAAARANPAIDAIVIRIDSPGGSALASELMYREVLKTRGKKPIICSMGDVAASGGYFVAAGCDTIFADPLTITGSIGIFAGKVDVSGLLSKLGVSWKTFQRGKHADMASIFRPYTPEERAILQSKIRYFYNRFVAAVAKGRDMSAEAVNRVGEGRVWTGADARPIGLVDTFGGIDDAIALAKRRAHIAASLPVRIVSLPREGSGLLSLIAGQILGHAASHAAAIDIAHSWLGPLLAAVPGSLVVDPGMLQARLPFAMVWQ